MKLPVIVTSVSVAAALTLGVVQLASAARQPDKNVKDKAPAAQPDHDKMMEQVKQFAEPGPEHKRLVKLVGTWDCSVKFYEPDETGKMTEKASKGEAKFTSELSDRWVRQDFKGEFEGEKFQGFGHTGYDKIKQQYFATWADTMSTSMMIMIGAYDEATKTLTTNGTFTFPGMGDIGARHVFQEKDADTMIFTMYHSMEGQEMKVGEITYKRRK